MNQSLNDFIVWNCGKPIQGRNRVMNGSAILSALRIHFPRRPLLQRDPHPTLLVRIATVSQPPYTLGPAQGRPRLAWLSGDFRLCPIRGERQPFLGGASLGLRRGTSDKPS